jgi:hypothetical protein
MAKRSRPPSRPAGSTAAAKAKGAARIGVGCQSLTTRPVETLP